METVLFIALVGCIGVTAGLLIALAVLSYLEREEIFNREIRRQQDLHVSAQINSLHRTIQELQRINKQLMATNGKLATVTVTRMNDTPVIKTVHTSAKTVGG